jgi:hypothetical protein
MVVAQAPDRVAYGIVAHLVTGGNPPGSLFEVTNFFTAATHATLTR